MARSILDLSPRPTAVFASNDYMAAVLKLATQRNLRVPDDISIGFDNAPIAPIWPGPPPLLNL